MRRPPWSKRINREDYAVPFGLGVFWAENAIGLRADLRYSFFLASLSLLQVENMGYSISRYFLSVVLAWSCEGKCTLYALCYPSGTEGLSD